MLDALCKLFVKAAQGEMRLTLVLVSVMLSDIELSIFGLLILLDEVLPEMLN